MSESLPLPEPYFPAARKAGRDGGYEVQPAFTSDQLRAYGAACASAERERCARHIDVFYERQGSEFAAAIRNME